MLKIEAQYVHPVKVKTIKDCKEGDVVWIARKNLDDYRVPFCEMVLAFVGDDVILWGSPLLQVSKQIARGWSCIDANVKIVGDS
jgi:hypothetical protein